MPEKKVVLASRNPGKIREFSEMLTPYGIDVLSIADFNNIPEIVETGTSFVENAEIKARAIQTVTNFPVIADDSGLVIAALNGEPGIFSARYAGDHNDEKNIAKVLDKLKGKTQRNAYFNTTLVCLNQDGEKLVINGKEPGKIAETKRGGSGFGYDPIFIPNGFDKTMAELTASEKNKVSSRGDAINQLENIIKKRLS